MLAWALWGNQVLKPLYCLLSWLWVAKFNYSTIHCGLNVLIEVHQHCLSSRGRIPINLFIQIPDPMIWHMGRVALSLPSSILHTAEDRPMPVTSELSDVCSVMDTEQATPNLKLHLLPWAGKESAKGMRKEQMNQGQNWYFLLCHSNSTPCPEMKSWNPGLLTILWSFCFGCAVWTEASWFGLGDSNLF